MLALWLFTEKVGQPLRRSCPRQTWVVAELLALGMTPGLSDACVLTRFLKDIIPWGQLST